MLNVYVMQDSLSLETGEIFCASSDAVVRRLMDNAATQSALDTMPGIKDVVCYRIGTFNSDTLLLDGDTATPIYRMSSALAKAKVLKDGDADA